MCLEGKQENEKGKISNMCLEETRIEDWPSYVLIMEGIMVINLVRKAKESPTLAAAMDTS